MKENSEMKATGPLRVHPVNPRYFTDGTDKAIYLTGSHTWNNFKDMGKADPPPRFDFDAYLDFLQEHGHNFIRLWTWDLATYTYDGEPTYARPFPWPRTGPGNALDGKPKFDLMHFDKSFFDRLRSRALEAGLRGIYVSIMLFEGHGLQASLPPWCWDGHPLNVKNNINGIDGDRDADGRGLEVQSLKDPTITALLEAYVREAIDAVNDLDNVLYEIVNESGTYSTDWQYHFIHYIKEYERGKPKQHPVGMTFQWSEKFRGTNENLFNGPADWISPSPDGGYRDNPPASDGRKVILSDTDHLWGIGGNRAWVWKSFCRGMNVLFMDPYHDAGKEDALDGGQGTTWTEHLRDTPKLDRRWDPIRRDMGHALSYAKRMRLAAAVPSDDLASTRYCLANPGAEYLVYLPDGGDVTVDLTGAPGELDVEWLDPSTGERVSGGKMDGGSPREFTAPFKGDAILYIFAKGG